MRIPALILAVLLAACSDPPPVAPVLEERFSGSYTRTPEERAEVLGRFQSYWQAIARRDWDTAYELLTWDYREKISRPEWQAAHTGLGLPRADRIHWIKGVHRHQGPELYAVLDWSSGGQYGRLIWRQDPDGFWIENTKTRLRRR